MLCPICETENRSDRASCYNCEADLQPLRETVSQARQLYNESLEHAERGRVSDGIRCMEQALAINARFINAWVVLGTLYAREEEFDKADAAWQSALAIRPELQKAHGYLEKLRPVQNSLPAVRGYRYVSGVLMLVAVGLALALIFVLQPKPEWDDLTEANNYYTQGQFGRASEVLVEVQEESKPDSPVHISAKALQKAIESEMSQLLRQIRELTYANKFPEALTAVRELERIGPDTETSQSLNMIRQHISFFYDQRLDDLFLEFMRGEIVLADLEEEIETYRSALPLGEQTQELDAYLQEARGIEAEHDVARIRDAFAQDKLYTVAAQQLRELEARYENNESFEASKLKLIDMILSYMFDTWFPDLIEQREYAVADEVLLEIDELSQEFQIDVSGPVDFARRYLMNTQKDDVFNDVAGLIAADEYEGALEALALLMTRDDLTQMDRQAITDYWREADFTSRGSNLARLAVNETVLSEGEATSAVLQLAVDTYDALNQYRRPTDQSQIVALRALAALQMNEVDVATSMTSQLRALDGSTTYVRLLNRRLKAERENQEIKPALTKPAEKQEAPKIRIENVDSGSTDTRRSSRSVR